MTMFVAVGDRLLRRQSFTIEFVEEGGYAPLMARCFRLVVVATVATISITVAIAESVAIAETISKTVTISKIPFVVQIGDRWWNRVSIVAIAQRRRIGSVSHLRDRCGVRHFCDGRWSDDFSDSWSYRDLKTKQGLNYISFVILFRIPVYI